MNMQWDAKIGPASIIGILGFAGTIASIWFGLKADVSTALQNSTEARRVAHSLSQKADDHGIRLGKLETANDFVVPALQRIEQKLDRATPHP